MDGSETGRKRGRRVAKKDRGMDESPRKCTFVLSAKLDTKISTYSKMRGINRSAALAELLDEQLAPVVVSFRGAREDAEPAPPLRVAREDGAGEGDEAAA